MCPRSPALALRGDGGRERKSPAPAFTHRVSGSRHAWVAWRECSLAGTREPLPSSVSHLPGVLHVPRGEATTYLRACYACNAPALPFITQRSTHGAPVLSALISGRSERGCSTLVSPVTVLPTSQCQVRGGKCMIGAGVISPHAGQLSEFGRRGCDGLSMGAPEGQDLTTPSTLRFRWRGVMGATKTNPPPQELANDVSSSTKRF